MAEYVLYGAPGRASIAPQIVLEEVGAPYRYDAVEPAAAPHRTGPYLRLDSGSKVPVLVDVDGDFAVSEAAAICLHLADRHPEAGLLAPPGSPDRTRAYQALLFLSGTVQPTLMEYFYPQRHAADAAGEAFVQANAFGKLAVLWQLLDRELRGRSSVLPGGFGICDAYLYMLASWHRDEARPLAGYEHLWRVVVAAAARPSVRRVAVEHCEASAAWWSAAIATAPELRG